MAEQLRIACSNKYYVCSANHFAILSRSHVLSNLSCAPGTLAGPALAWGSKAEWRAGRGALLQHRHWALQRGAARRCLVSQGCASHYKPLQSLQPCPAMLRRCQIVAREISCVQGPSRFITLGYIDSEAALHTMWMDTWNL